MILTSSSSSLVSLTIVHFPLAAAVLKYSLMILTSMNLSHSFISYSELMWENGTSPVILWYGQNQLDSWNLPKFFYLNKQSTTISTGYSDWKVTELCAMSHGIWLLLWTHFFIFLFIHSQRFCLKFLVDVGDQDLQLSESFTVLLESNWTMTQDFIEAIQLNSLIIYINFGDVSMWSYCTCPGGLTHS